MRFRIRALRAGILLIAPVLWFVLIDGRGSADTPAPAASGTVELKEVKYGGLVDFVKSQRGKVVVVDVWGAFCLPCMKAYPHLIEMHKKYASQGLVCISVSVDQDKTKPKALPFLQKMESTIPNFWLDEPMAVWQERWGVSGPPLLFVFDKAGRRAGKFSAGTAEEVEKLVKELLQVKP